MFPNPILQVGKLRLGAVRQLAQGHTCKWQALDPNPVLPDFKTHVSKPAVVCVERIIQFPPRSRDMQKKR